MRREEYAGGGNFYTLPDTDAATVSIYAATPVNVHTCGSHHPFPSVATYYRIQPTIHNSEAEKSQNLARHSSGFKIVQM